MYYYYYLYIMGEIIHLIQIIQFIIFSKFFDFKYIVQMPNIIAKLQIFDSSKLF